MLLLLLNYAVLRALWKIDVYLISTLAHITMEEKLVRLQKRAARVILDCDLYTPSSTMFSDLKWMSFLERVISMKAI